MKRQKFIILVYFLLPLFFLDATSLRAQTKPAYYYVSPDGKDSNPGTESLPWKTLARATSMATAGTTVFIMQGICNAIYKNLIGLNLIAFAGTDIDSLRIFNNLIFQNTSVGIYTNFEQPAGQYVLRNIGILNNTIYENGTSINSWGDGGINITGIVSENLLIRNNILSNNAAYTICVQPEVPADSVTIDYNFFDGFQNFLYETVGTNPVYGNPLFIDYLTNDYHLQATSTAIDKGDPYQQYNDPVDPNKPGYALSPAQGTIRNDMGAYGGPFASSWDLAASVATPMAPTLILPSNGETGVPATLLLNWDGPWGATSYQLQVSTSSDFSSQRNLYCIDELATFHKSCYIDGCLFMQS